MGRHAESSLVYSEDSGEDDNEKKKSPPALVFENPDGSLHHALPIGTRYKRSSGLLPDATPDDRFSREWFSWDPQLLLQLERIYAKHERVLLILLFLQFLLENSFNALLIKHRQSTANEILRSYPFLTEEYAPVVFWTLVACSALFAGCYYVTAAVSVWERRSGVMKLFSDVAIVGILGQVCFAYINRFNLILFFLRFVVFAHSRFLLSILNGTAGIVVQTIRNAGVTGDNQPIISIEV